MTFNAQLLNEQSHAPASTPQSLEPCGSHVSRNVSGEGMLPLWGLIYAKERFNAPRIPKQ